MAEIEWTIRWTPRAYENIEQISLLISQNFSEKTAQDFVKEVINTIENNIKSFPYMFKKVPNLKDDTIRQALVKKYRIIYEINKKEKIIRIVTIFHSSWMLKF